MFLNMEEEQIVENPLSSINDIDFEKALEENIERIKVGLSIQDLENFMNDSSNDLIDISKEIQLIKDTEDLYKKSHCFNQIQEEIRKCTVRNYNDIAFLVRLVCVLDLQKYEMNSNVSLLRHVLGHISVKHIPAHALKAMMNDLANQIISISSVNGDRIHLLNKLASADDNWDLLTVLAAWRTLMDIYRLQIPMSYSLENLRTLLDMYPLPNSVLDIKLAIHAIFKIVYKAQLIPSDEEYLVMIKKWLQYLGPKIDIHIREQKKFISPRNLCIITSMISRAVLQWPSVVKNN